MELRMDGHRLAAISCPEAVTPVAVEEGLGSQFFIHDQVGFSRCSTEAGPPPIYVERSNCTSSLGHPLHRHTQSRRTLWTCGLQIPRAKRSSQPCKRPRRPRWAMARRSGPMAGPSSPPFFESTL